MPLTPSDQRFLKAIYARFSDAPLQLGDKRYEPLHEVLGEADPVMLMARHISFNEPESIQLFSGFSGSGKTTELLRLKGQLEKDKTYVVLYADALEYVNPAEPVDISDLLMVLAGSFSEQLEKVLGSDIGYEPFWTRAHNFLTGTELSLQEVGIKTGVDLKLQIKTASSFRGKLQQFLATRIGELKAQVDHFFEDGIKAIRAKRGENTQLVFIFDSLEQIRGNYQNWESVIRSVDQLFSVHIDRLRIPYTHVVYAVPPWLKFLARAGLPVTMLPTVHLWNNDRGRSDFVAGWDAFRRLIDRRLPSGDAGRLFGAEPAKRDALRDRLIAAAAGHVRDLLRMVREALTRAVSLPLTAREVDAVINAARRDFLPIALDDARWLANISGQRNTALDTVDERSVERLSRFLDTHVVLYFVNGDAWYDTHPLIREEVDKVLRAATADS